MKREIFKSIGCNLQRINDERRIYTQQLTRGHLRDIAAYKTREKCWERETEDLLRELVSLMCQYGWERLVIEAMQEHTNIPRALFDCLGCRKTKQARNGGKNS